MWAAPAHSKPTGSGEDKNMMHSATAFAGPISIQPRDRARLSVMIGRALAELRGSSSPRRRAVRQRHRFEEDRPVRANFVSCNPPSPVADFIGDENPVGTIRKANTRAIALLDNAIGQLQRTRNRIVAGAAAGSPTVSDAMSRGLQRRFGLDANLRSIWTGTGARSVLVLIRRLRGARQILADGWMRYTCLGNATVTLGDCAVTPGNGCAPGVRAVACGGHSRIVLCAPWWTDDLGIDKLDAQARTLLHECIHIYFGFIGDEGNFTNAHCYDQFVFDLNGLTVPAGLARRCP
jgi:hypothetical protein